MCGAAPSRMVSVGFSRSTWLRRGCSSSTTAACRRIGHQPYHESRNRRTYALCGNFGAFLPHAGVLRLVLRPERLASLIAVANRIYIRGYRSTCECIAQLRELTKRCASPLDCQSGSLQVIYCTTDWWKKTSGSVLEIAAIVC